MENQVKVVLTVILPGAVLHRVINKNGEAEFKGVPAKQVTKFSLQAYNELISNNSGTFPERVSKHDWVGAKPSEKFAILAKSMMNDLCGIGFEVNIL